MQRVRILKERLEEFIEEEKRNLLIVGNFDIRLDKLNDRDIRKNNYRKTKVSFQLRDGSQAIVKWWG